MKTRLISLLLALTMLFSFSVSVFAEEGECAEEEEIISSEPASEPEAASVYMEAHAEEPDSR